MAELPREVVDVLRIHIYTALRYPKGDVWDIPVTSLCGEKGHDGCPVLHGLCLQLRCSIGLKESCVTSTLSAASEC